MNKSSRPLLDGSDPMCLIVGELSMDKRELSGRERRLLDYANCAG